MNIATTQPTPAGDTTAGQSPPLAELELGPLFGRMIMAMGLAPREVAQHFKHDRAAFNNFLNGRQPISAGVIRRKNWLEFFENRNPAVFAEFEALLQQKLNAAAAAATASLIAQRRNDTLAAQPEFGNVLKLFVSEYQWQKGQGAGERLYKYEVSRLFGISVFQLTAYLESKARPGQRLVRQRDWASILSRHCPALWQQHSALIEAAIQQLPNTDQPDDRPVKPKRQRAVKAPQPADTEMDRLQKEWKDAVGAFIKDTRQRRGQDMQEIASHMADAELQSIIFWQAIETGKQTRDIADYHKALRNFGRLLELNATRDERERKTYRRLLENPPV